MMPRVAVKSHFQLWKSLGRIEISLIRVESFFVVVLCFFLLIGVPFGSWHAFAGCQRAGRGAKARPTTGSKIGPPQKFHVSTTSGCSKKCRKLKYLWFSTDTVTRIISFSDSDWKGRPPTELIYAGGLLKAYCPTELALGHVLFSDILKQIWLTLVYLHKLNFWKVRVGRRVNFVTSRLRSGVYGANVSFSN